MYTIYADSFTKAFEFAEVFALRNWLYKDIRLFQLQNRSSYKCSLGCILVLP